MNPALLKRAVEAALMALPDPLSVKQLVALFDKEPEPPGRDAVCAVLQELQQDYAERGVILAEVASGFRFQVHSDCAAWVNTLFDARPQRYSRALLETLAIIAYKQPLTRGEIEAIRGVSVNTNIIRTLQEREWIKVVGYRDVPGKPELLATTRQFLDYFNLKKLADLPPLAEIKDFDKINPDLFAALEREASQAITAQPPAEASAAANSAGPGQEAWAAEAEQAPAAEDVVVVEDNVVPFSH